MTDSKAPSKRPRKAASSAKAGTDQESTAHARVAPARVAQEAARSGAAEAAYAGAKGGAP